MKALPPAPAGSPRRRGTPPSLLRASSHSGAFPAADDGDHDAAVSEHAYVTLQEWWLATAEGDDQKIAVAGRFERDKELHDYSPAPIAKRHMPLLLETEDGTILRIDGSLNVSHTHHNGYSTTVCSDFLNGFPDRWQSCKPCNSGVDSTQFFLEKFEQGTNLISKFQDILGSFSHNDAVFEKSSHLLNGTPRFEEYTCDGDIATNENTAGSSEAATGKERTPVVSLEVHGCWKGTQHMSLTEMAAVDEEMPASVYLDHKKTPMASLKSQGSWKVIALNKKVHQSPPTRVKDTSWSMTTVEALNLKRSRSGRTGDDEGGEDALARRRCPRVAGRKVSMKKGSQPSSSRGRSNIGVRKSLLKKVRKPKGNEKGATEHFLTRFSVHRIRELVPGLDEDQKGWIALSGHGSLLSMSEFSVPVKLVKWIMQHIDPLLYEFKLDDKVIIFDRSLICKILGFENGTKPLDLSVDVGRVFRDQYMDGNRAKLRRCIQVLKSSKDRDSFMRAFMLLALGSVYCPGTTNAVCLNYLNSLYDVSKIKEFDWAGHILELLMEEVTKYQKLSPEQLERNHCIAGCLAILAIAYMDHLDIPKDLGTHQICYDVPRICNVSKKDFEFVMSVDMQSSKLHSYGMLPFRAVTPYSTPPNTTEHPMADEVHVHSSAASLDDWLHPSGPSNQSAQQVPPEYEPIITETNSLIKCDIDELVEAMAADFKVKCKGIYKNRLGEMAVKLMKLTHQGPCSTCNATTKPKWSESKTDRRKKRKTE